jgi:hypothetical protein
MVFLTDLSGVSLDGIGIGLDKVRLGSVISIKTRIWILSSYPVEGGSKGPDPTRSDPAGSRSAAPGFAQIKLP